VRAIARASSEAVIKRERCNYDVFALADYGCTDPWRVNPVSAAAASDKEHLDA